MIDANLIKNGTIGDWVVANVPDKNVGELISRKALVNALTNWQMEYAEKDEDDERFETLGAVIELVEQMPTIEPKRGKWMPCKKQMPKPNEVVGDVVKYYLVQNECGDMMVASYNAEGDARWWEQMYQYGAIHDEIVAWMELPDEYKEGGR